MDAARSAKKISAYNKVIISCIETESTIPAFAEEVQRAKEEGLKFIYDSFVKNCSEMKNGKISVTLYSFGRKKFLQDLQCDHIITAIGQTSEISLFDKMRGDKIDKQGRIKNKNAFTGYENIFVAGDLSSGNNMSVIGAIASGKKSAVAVRKLLENYKYEYEGEKALSRLNNHPLPKKREPDAKVLPFGKDLGWAAFNLYQPCAKCNHCIDNFGCPAMVKVNGKVKIDESRCTLCGLCIDVCPNNAIQWETVKEEELESAETK